MTTPAINLIAPAPLGHPRTVLGTNCSQKQSAGSIMAE